VSAVVVAGVAAAAAAHGDVAKILKRIYLDVVV
jgi:hypothetical protein